MVTTNKLDDDDYDYHYDYNWDASKKIQQNTQKQLLQQHY